MLIYFGVAALGAVIGSLVTAFFIYRNDDRRMAELAKVMRA